MQSDHTKIMSDYLAAFQKFRLQAQKDSRINVVKLLDFFLGQDKMNDSYLEKCDFIYLNIDDMSEEMASFIIYLEEKKKDLEWYKIAGFIADEKENPEKFYSTICNFLDSDVDVLQLRDYLEESSSLQEFEKKIQSIDCLPAEQVSDAYVEHLVSQNKWFQEQVEQLQLKLDSVQEELRNAIVENTQSKRTLFSFELEKKKTEKILNSCQSKIRLLENKNSRLQEVVDHQENICNSLRNEKLTLIQQVEDLSKSNEQYKDTIEELNQKCMEIENSYNENEGAYLESDDFSEIDEFHPENEDDAYIEDFIDEEESEDEILSKLLEAEENDYFFPEEIGIPALNEDIEVPEENTDIGVIENEIVFLDEELIPIEKGVEETRRKTNFFVKIFEGRKIKHFLKKTESEQDNVIFVKMMEKSFSKDNIQIIKKAFKEEQIILREELYKMLLDDVSEMEIVKACSIEM